MRERQVHLRCVLRTVVVFAFGLAVVGCNASRVAFDKVVVGEPMPDDIGLPEARCSSIGLGYFGGDVGASGFPGELAHRLQHCLLVLTDLDEKVKGKLYIREEFQGYGWLLSTELEILMEFMAPEQYWAAPPEDWSGEGLITELFAANEDLRRRIEDRPDLSSGQSTPSPTPFYGPVPVTGAELLERYLMTPTGATSSGNRARHIGQWTAAMTAALGSVPAQYPLRKEARLFDGMFEASSLFFNLASPGDTASHFDGEYHYTIRRLEQQRLRIEIRQRRNDSAFSGVSYH